MLRNTTPVCSRLEKPGTNINYLHADKALYISQESLTDWGKKKKFGEERWQYLKMDLVAGYKILRRITLWYT